MICIQVHNIAYCTQHSTFIISIQIRTNIVCHLSKHGMYPTQFRAMLWSRLLLLSLTGAVSLDVTVLPGLIARAEGEWNTCIHLVALLTVKAHHTAELVLVGCCRVAIIIPVTKVWARSRCKCDAHNIYI